MNNCIFCNQKIANPLSFSFIFSFKPLKTSLVCEACMSNFEFIDIDQACVGCSRQQSHKKYCPDCQKWLKLYPDLNLTHRALYKYNEKAKEYMEKFKFQGDILLSAVFAEQIHDALKDFKHTHHIIPIPLSPSSKQNRGFNQVEIMLQRAEIPYDRFLIHVGNEKKQSTKNRQERIQTKQPFLLNEEYKEVSKYKKPFLIVDDVYTTGRTILHARNLLNQLPIDDAKEHKTIESLTPTSSFTLFR